MFHSKFKLKLTLLLRKDFVTIPYEVLLKRATWQICQILANELIACQGSNEDDPDNILSTDQFQQTCSFRNSPETKLNPCDIRSLITEIKDLKDQFEKLRMEWLDNEHSFAGLAEPCDKSITSRDSPSFGQAVGVLLFCTSKLQRFIYSR